MVKIVNINGSSFGNSCNAGFWGLLRNNNDSWIEGFSGSCEKASNILNSQQFGRLSIDLGSCLYIYYFEI